MAATILVLEDDDDLRDALCEMLETPGSFGCLPLPSYAAMLADPQRALACELAFIDVNLGADAPSGVDAYHWLREHGFRGRIAFLTGHGRGHPVVEAARALPNVSVLEKPVAFDVLEAFTSGPR